MTEQRGKKSDFNNGGGGFREASGSNRQQGANSNSSNSSDRIVFITNGEPIKTVWKKFLRKHPLNQSDVRILVNSALVAMDYQSEVEELVTELGNPESGLKRLREIINFPLMSCDAGLDGVVLSFQYVILPLLGLLTRIATIECNLKECVRAIFMTVYTNLDSFLYDNVMKLLEKLVQRDSIVDNKVSVEELLSRGQHSFIPSSLGMFFLIIIRFLTELLHRVNEASVNETMYKIVHDLQQLKTTYQQSTSALTDPLINDLETGFMILEKEMKNTNEMLTNPNSSSYVLPGRRHNNDFKEISKISIIPTKEEILCDHPPFLSSSNPDAPHFLPEGMARLLDTQFRLLREDMLNPIRSSLSNFITTMSEDLSSSTKNGELKKRGGRFRCDSGDLQVFAGVKFIRTNCDRKKGLTCTLRLQSRCADNKLMTGSLVILLLPNPHPMNYSDLYSLYFGIVISNVVYHFEIDINFDLSIYPIALHEISNPDKVTKESLETRFLIESTSVYFEAYYHILKNLQTIDPSSFPFEKYLAPKSDYLKMQDDKKGKRNKKARIDIKVESPMYTKESGFQFDLSVLCKNSQNKKNLKLNVADTKTHNTVVKDITKYSIISKPGKSDEYGLDETQAKALVYALTREIALIEGPPGTGKTVVGVQVMKVLLANKNQVTKIGPILTICFTNHALDQFLEDLLDEKITNNIIRLGSRTKSDKIKKFNLEEICAKTRIPNNRKELIEMLKATLEKIECDINKLKTALPSFKKKMSWNDIREYLMNEESEYYVKFITEYGLPSWIFEVIEEVAQNKQSDLAKQISEGAQNKQSNDVEGTDEEISEEEELEEEESEEEFEGEFEFEEFEEEFEREFEGEFEFENFEEFVGEIYQGQNSIFSEITHCDKDQFQLVQNQRKTSLFEQWLTGEDIKIINKAKKIYQENSNDESQWVQNYKEPNTNRPLGILLKERSLWQMSIVERRKLHDYWRTKINNQFVEKLSELQRMHEEKRQEMNDIYDERRRQVLLNSDVIGMTTNGAAKFQSLIKSIGPKIIICEEAGEVLEAHILSALTTSTQHLILIGDHNQLRPHITTYSLSIDSPVENYQLDKSLFERLVHGDNAVKIEKTQLLTQRRMRKEISDLIRGTLYPNLIDGDNTAKYPNVRGVQHNVYFINHKHPEDSSGSELTTKSHVNKFEVKMVVEMVKYFVKNGYTEPEDIAVLTPYLGQMINIKNALAQSFDVVIDERDAQIIAEIEEMEENVTNVSNKLKLNQQITLRTVDNFQGEEANIVIISLVRNFSESGRHDSIGFLKSSNRSNVLLSRAREGMYLIGNSELMAAKSKDMWAPVVDILKTRDPPQVGFGMPIVCNRHNYKNTITEPEQFAKFSPNGGCNQQCGELLSCGHACTHECRHSDDPNHIKYKCSEPCSKLHSECNHLCTRYCYQDCGKCNFLIRDFKLPGCGHTLQNVKCWQNKIKDTFECTTIVTKKLPRCDHTIDICCNEPVDKVICKRVCGKILECGHECLEECFDCPKHSKHSILRRRSTNKHPSRCNVSIGNIKLPGCSHVLKNAKCWQKQNIASLECMILVTKKLPRCNHFKILHCYKSVDDDKCGEKCSKVLECGHECLDECFDCPKHSIQGRYQRPSRCNFSVDIRLSGCGHVIKNAKCWQNQAQETLKCIERCGKNLECGHKCLNECFNCPKHSLRGRSINKDYSSRCNFTVNIKLSGCGHVFQNAKCWQNQAQETLKCMKQVTKKLSQCKHSKVLHCYESADNVKCIERCGKKLECGHECLDECYNCPKHSLQGRSVNKHPSRCNFSVHIRLSGCGHVIPNAKCWQNQAQETLKCMKQVTKKLSQCKHSKVLHCYESVNNVKCIERCGKKLECGHECIDECYNCPKHSLQERFINSNPSHCKITVDIKLSGCGHVIKNAKCWQNQAQETLKCMKQVTKKLSQCKHSKVLHCYESVDNVECIERCGKKLECGHECLDECYNCPKHSLQDKSINSHPSLCYFPAGNIILPGCGHRFQNAKCWQNQTKETLKCETLVSKQLPHCKHSKSIHCYEPVDDVKCIERCEETLECGHRCLNECFECPEHSTLQKVSIKNERKLPSICNFPVGDITLPTCGHVFQDAKCWQTKETLKCMIRAVKKLPHCEHFQVFHCYESIDNVKCIKKCSKVLECGHKCLNECFNCPKHSTLQKGSINEKNLPSICNVSVGGITLPTCGHVFQNAECWQNQVKETLKCETLVSKQLPHCNHSKLIHCYESVDDVKCLERCEETLECGHKCSNKCFKCPEHSILQKESINERKLPNICNFPVGDITLPTCGHAFQDAKCWQTKETLECMIRVTKKLSYCEHLQVFHCHESVDNVKCKEKCGKILDCGHKCLNECFNCPKHSTLQKESINEHPSLCNFPAGNITLPGCGHIIRNAKCWQNQTKETLKCKTMVSRKLLHCKHYKSIHCYESVDNVKCIEKCENNLECGHLCLNECFKCPEHSTEQNQTIETLKCMTQVTRKLPHCEHSKLIYCYESVYDIECKEKCGKFLKCGHKCKKCCHKETECPPCKSKCTISCRHTIASCDKSCSEPCAVCARKCSWECKHQGKCELSCGAPCYRLPCNERCDKKMNCGHKCMGICGEVCLTKEFCDFCASKKVKNQVSDTINNTIFSKVNWYKERMIVLNCGHVYTMETMDMIMEMEYFYEGSTKSGWTSIKPLPTSITSIKTCPECQTPIKDIRRYGRIIKKYVLDAQIEKFRLKYDKQFKGIKQIVLKDTKRRRVQLKNYLPKFKFNEGFNFIPDHYFENIEKYRGFSNNEQVWINYIKNLLKRHRKLNEIICATEKPPHKEAFDASALALQLTRFDPSESLQLNSQETQEALSQLGIPIPQIDRRIYLDTIIEIINVQKIIFDEILFIIQKISKENDSINIKGGWSKLAESMQNSIQNNLNKMRNVAESYHYDRDLLLINVEILEFNLETLKFQLTKTNEYDVQTKIMEQCREIKKSIDIIRSEEIFRSDIHKRLENLYEDCDRVEIRTKQEVRSYSSVI